MLIGVFGIYMPLISWLGIWDERSLKTFKRAVGLSGPSIWIIYPMYKIFETFYKKSPFKKQSYVELGEVAERELEELSLMRYEKFVDYVNDNENKES